MFHKKSLIYAVLVVALVASMSIYAFFLPGNGKDASEQEKAPELSAGDNLTALFNDDLSKEEVIDTILDDLENENMLQADLFQNCDKRKLVQLIKNGLSERKRRKKDIYSIRSDIYALTFKIFPENETKKKLFERITKSNLNTFNTGVYTRSVYDSTLSDDLNFFNDALLYEIYKEGGKYKSKKLATLDYYKRRLAIPDAAMKMCDGALSNYLAKRFNAVPKDYPLINILQSSGIENDLSSEKEEIMHFVRFYGTKNFVKPKAFFPNITGERLQGGTLEDVLKTHEKVLEKAKTKYLELEYENLGGQKFEPGLYVVKLISEGDILESLLDNIEDADIDEDIFSSLFEADLTGTDVETDIKSTLSSLNIAEKSSEETEAFEKLMALFSSQDGLPEGVSEEFSGKIKELLERISLIRKFFLQNEQMASAYRIIPDMEEKAIFLLMNVNEEFSFDFSSIDEFCRPICREVGSKGEGWYDSCTGNNILFAQCAGYSPTCLNIGTRSEGWYSDLDQKLIQYEQCGEKLECEKYPVPEIPPGSDCVLHKDYDEKGCPKYELKCPEECPEAVIPDIPENMDCTVEKIIDEKGCPKYELKCSEECPQAIIPEIPKNMNCTVKTVYDEKGCPVYTLVCDGM